MQTIRTLLAAALLVVGALPAFGQTIKTLGYNITNGHVVYSGTNTLTFTNALVFGDDVSANAFETSSGSNSVRFDSAGVTFGGSAAAATRTNVGLGATWLTNTDVTNFRTAIGLGAVNNVEFTDITAVNLLGAGNTNVVIDLDDSWLMNDGNVILEWQVDAITAYRPLSFNTTTNAATTRTNLGLGATNDVTFESVNAQELSAPLVQSFSGTNSVSITPDDIEFAGISAAATRTNLGLGASNIVTFAGLTNNGDIRINQTATNNGLLYVYRTNSEAFLGLANLIASNNVTVSNETLFRVGVAEATNKAAQFGFRATNTNGTGVAVFSTFGNNALMMIGASDRSQTNAAIEADIWTISPTNRVMTLRDTNTGAMTMHRDIGFAATLTNAAPTNTTNVAVWLRVWVGTNSYRLPLYQ